jgi:hypothetical protein
MKSVAIVVAAACALPLAALAEDFPMPRMMQGMEKGSWRSEILEHSEAKGQRMPAMTICTDNLMKQAKEHQAAGKGERRECKQRLLKDASDEAVMETTCQDSTVVTTIKRETSKSMLADIKSTGKHPMTMKMRYTYVGACREGQAAMGLDKDSEQCEKIRASVAKMDPAKSCAGAGTNREQCESMMRQQIAQAKAMCGN